MFCSNFSLSGGNLFWGMQFRTCKNFWDFADSKSSLNPKNSYKYKSHTAITSIVIRVANQLRFLRNDKFYRHYEANRRFAEAIQNFCDSKNDKNKSARSATLKASSGAGVGIVREGEGSDFAIQAPTPSLKENARGQKSGFNADLSAESRKEIDSRFALDSRDLDSSRCRAQNDESFINYHESLCNSHNHNA